jgi:thiosulfate/3-mercaptopyruvate sulfurtransferase
LKNENSTVVDVRDAYCTEENLNLSTGSWIYPGAINIPFSENLDENGFF